MGNTCEGQGHLGRISRNIAWISVAISVAVMLVAICVVDGFKREIGDKATGFSGSVMMVAPGQSPVNEIYPFSERLSYKEKIVSLRGVESLSGVAYRSGILKSGGNICGIYFKGVDSLYDFSFFEKSLVEGIIPQYTGRISNDVLLSRRLADQMGYKLGDQMLAYFVGEEVRVRKFNVTGIFDAQLEEIDKSFIITDRRQVQRLNSWTSDQVSCVEIHTSPDVDIESMRSRIEDLEFSSSEAGDAGLFVTSVKKIYYNLFDWLALLDLNVLMVLILMMAVAGFNMLSAVLIILFENISVIGLFKSLGMTDRRVSQVFLWRSASIVGRGVAAGNVFAIAVALIQKYTHFLKLDPANYFVKFVPIEFDVLKIVALDIISSLVIMLMLMLSTRMISRISPDRTMRVE